jgi:hypothetical protein
VNVHTKIAAQRGKAIGWINPAQLQFLSPGPPAEEVTGNCAN